VNGGTFAEIERFVGDPNRPVTDLVEGEVRALSNVSAGGSLSSTKRVHSFLMKAAESPRSPSSETLKSVSSAIEDGCVLEKRRNWPARIGDRDLSDDGFAIVPCNQFSVPLCLVAIQKCRERPKLSETRKYRNIALSRP
jgi:hypothetical protein